MLQNPPKTLGFKKIWSTKFPLQGGGKPYSASGLYGLFDRFAARFAEETFLFTVN